MVTSLHGQRGTSGHSMRHKEGSPQNTASHGAAITPTGSAGLRNGLRIPRP